MGDVYTYIGQDGSLGEDGNWYDQTTNMIGGPPGADDVAIVQYGTLLTGSLTVDDFLLEQGCGGAPLALTGASTAIAASYFVVAGIATLEDGAAASVDSLELVGGGTTLDLRTGAGISGNSSDGGNVLVGASSGAALLSVAGLTANFDYSSVDGMLEVGGAQASTATLSVTGGGAVSGEYGDALIGDADGATGRMVVSGAGSVAELDNAVEIGDLGTGSLTVEKGGYASLGGGVGVIVGSSDDGSAVKGTLTVTDRSSLLGVDGVLDVGFSGSGRVLVEAGATLTVSNDTNIGTGGSLTVTGKGSAFEGRTLAVGAAADMTAVTVAKGASLDIVTLDLEAGRVALSGGEVDIRRSDYVSAGAGVRGFGTMAAAAIYNSGLLQASGGALRVTGAVSGSGQAQIEGKATLQYDDAVGNGQTVTFEAATGSLGLADGKDFAGAIAGFAKGDMIDLLGQAATSLSFEHDTLRVENGSKTVADLTLQGSYKATGFHLASDGHGGSAITYASAQGVQSEFHGWLALA